MQPRAIFPLLTATACLFACDPAPETSTPDDAAPADTAGADADAAATADAEAQAKAEAEEKAKAEQAAKLAEAFAELEASKAKSAERWTDKVNAGAKKLAAKKHKNAKAAIKAILASSHRDPANAERDAQRHPAETLAFFGLKQNMTVVELGPGGGWYTEILAPFLARSGKLVVNNGDANGPDTERGTYYARRFQYFLDQNADVYGKVVQEHPKDGELNIGAPESADAVLIIRGLHSQARRGVMDKTIATVHATLKPGGILGIVQHRAAEGGDVAETSKAGYVPQAWLVEQVTKAGFELEEASEINANEKDTRDHPEGVWTLPPVLALKDKDAEKYKAIGESDRMTLRFVKKK